MPRKYLHNSLTAKLTYLMTAVVMGTVAAMTIQSASKFSAYILQNIEETSTSMAERAAAGVAGILESWTDEMAAATTKLSSNALDANSNDADLMSTLNRDKDIIALTLYSIEAGTPKLLRVAVQKPDAKSNVELSRQLAALRQPRKIMADLAAEVAANPNLITEDRLIRNVTSLARVPTVLIALKFSIPNQPQKYAIMILLASMTKIQVLLPQSRFTSGYIIDGNGAIFSSTDELRLSSNTPISNNALVKSALLRKAPSGFLSEFTDSEKNAKIGSFSQIPSRIPLFVLVERDRKAAFQVITRMYVTSALWGLLILLLATMASYLSAGGVIQPLRDMVGATKRIASGDFSVRLNPLASDEIAELGHSVNNMASRIQNLMTGEVEKARLEKELETARLVQSTFFPKQDVLGVNLSVTGNYQPATECGGDLWGHYKVRDGVELVFIADAMGHGAPAALVTAIAYAVCKSISSILDSQAPIDPSPATLLRRLNTIILDAVDGKISMTFFAALFDFNTGVITYANAGHNFPFILTSDRNDSRLSALAKKSTEGAVASAVTLSLMGNPLGVDHNCEYKEKSITMCAGDKIIFFTDGLIENTLNGSQPYSRKSLISSVCSFGTDRIDIIKEKILARGRSIFGTENLQDDVTVVVAEISKSWIKSSSPTPEFVPPGALNGEDSALPMALSKDTIPSFSLDVDPAVTSPVLPSAVSLRSDLWTEPQSALLSESIEFDQKLRTSS
jgi:serine phosphatase RsbU (regulator of sigma subunit)